MSPYGNKENSLSSSIYTCERDHLHLLVNIRIPYYLRKKNEMKAYDVVLDRIMTNIYFLFCFEDVLVHPTKVFGHIGGYTVEYQNRKSFVKVRM